jgi:large subunit ribosomal protein L28
MSRKCDICGRGPMAGNNVSHSNNRTRKVSNINLQSVKTIVNKRTKRVNVCTRCIRNDAIVKKVK